jgi:transcription initiation factor TFIIH subunit 2
VCGLPLISSPHLARSYHHLFPVPAFEEVTQKTLLQLAAAAADGGSSSGGDGSNAVPWYEPGDTDPVAADDDGGGINVGAGGQAGLYCYGCLKPLMGSSSSSSSSGVPTAAQQQTSIVLRCGQCRHLFCYDCDAFVHESLHNCPGCESGAGAAGQEAAKAQATATAIG